MGGDVAITKSTFGMRNASIKELKAKLTNEKSWPAKPP
jgi:hypothetical protein